MHSGQWPFVKGLSTHSFGMLQPLQEDMLFLFYTLRVDVVLMKSGIFFFFYISKVDGIPVVSELKVAPTETPWPKQSDEGFSDSRQPTKYICPSV
jgi:hypothetical protein